MLNILIFIALGVLGMLTTSAVALIVSGILTGQRIAIPDFLTGFAILWFTGLAIVIIVL